LKPDSSSGLLADPKAKRSTGKRLIGHVSITTVCLKKGSLKPADIQALGCNDALASVSQADAAGATASRHQRWQVVCAVVIVSFLTILARAGISGAKAEMAHDLGINDLVFGVVFGAFALGYAIFMIPCGWLADHWGPRRSLACSVFFWSLFTLCTGLVSGITLLIFVRFLFGLAEAGVYPQATRALHNWTLLRERGLALGLLNMGSRLGAAAGLLFTPKCVAWLGWRESFVVLGIVGIVWAAVWFWWFRDRPKTRLDVVSKENPRRAAASKIPWLAFLSSRNVYLITYQYFASQFTFFICLSWLLPFLQSHYSMASTTAGLYSSIPLYCGALAMWTSGTVVDWIYNAGKWKLSRAVPAMFGFALAAVMLLPAPFMHSPGWFIACFALATFGLDLTVSPSWTVCCDVGGRYSGTLSAAMNTAGALGSLASSLLFPFFFGQLEYIKIYFYIAAFLNVFALLSWKYIEPSKSLEQGASVLRSDLELR
jgi:ACS family glucarate transporter-like MFS transporter